jgi:hypothetical protein
MITRRASAWRNFNQAEIFFHDQWLANVEKVYFVTWRIVARCHVEASCGCAQLPKKALAS